MTDVAAVRFRDTRGQGGAKRVPRTSIGLDIGSAAIKAIEVRFSGRSWTVKRYAQVGLPPGAVVDGEIRSQAEVSAALRRLWSDAGFSSRKVVLGVSGTRLVVRQADVPDLPDKEVRSALGFRIEDLVPLPSANVEFDFGPVPSTPGGEAGDRTVVLAAAHGDLIRSHLATAKDAKLQVEAVDAVPLALLRATPPGPGGGSDLVVTVGSDISVVAVRHGAVPAFIRILARGGGDITRVLAEATSHDLHAAEASKRTGSGSWREPQARAAVEAELQRLVGEVRDTVSFFSSRPDAGPPVEQVYLSGGGARTAGLVEQLSDALRLPITVVEAPTVGELEAAGLSGEQARSAGPAALGALGLALWPTAEPYSRLDLFPASIRAAERQHQHQVAAALVGAGVIVICAAAAGSRYLQLRHVDHQVTVERAQVADLHTQLGRFAGLTSLQDSVRAAHTTATDAMQGDVAWLRLLGDIGRVEPRGVHLTSFSGSASDLYTGQPAPSGNTAAGAVPLGSLSMQAQFDQKIPQVSNWLVALEKVPGLQDTWVSSVSSPTGSGGGQANAGQFSATATIGQQDLSNRPKTLPGGTK